MKKLTAAALLCASLLTTNSFAEESSELYVGLDLFKSSNHFTVKALWLEDKVTDDSDGFKLKFGADLNEGWRVQGYFQHETYDEAPFDATHDKLNELGVDVIKGFEVTPEFSPFIQAGVGTGWMDIEGYNEDSIQEVNIKIGAGVMYRFTEQFEAIAGIDFQARKWEDIQFLGVTMETSERSTRYYIGANIHF